MRKRAAGLAVAHLAIARVLGPHWALNEGEAMTLAEAVMRTEMVFDVKPNPKLLAVMGLGAAGTAIYGGRIAATAAAARQRAASKPAAGGQFRGRPAPPGQQQPQHTTAPPEAEAERVVQAAGAVIMPTGAPDAGRIDFGPA